MLPRSISRIVDYRVKKRRVKSFFVASRLHIPVKRRYIRNDGTIICPRIPWEVQGLGSVGEGVSSVVNGQDHRGIS